MDDEIDAMTRVAQALSELDQDKRDRILLWANQKFGTAGDPVWRKAAPREPDDVVRSEQSPAQFSTFGELFHAAGPSGERDKALLAAYWVQVVGKAENFASQSLNDLLKDLGYPVANITAALSQLQDDSPKLVIQLRKSGTSQQARKTYKLTDAGRRRAEEMVREEGDLGA